ncbi:hypothetical protein ACFU8X_27420 [Brevibacillus porteri]|uniref:hypothetical protein n=1 Tax=Brevibacillus porteri TaxID=2126350 RepID=UPI00370AAB7A
MRSEALNGLKKSAIVELIKCHCSQQGVLMDVGGTLAIVGARYGLLSDKKVQALQQAFELLLAAF